MRHGPAEDEAPSGRDFDRSLTPKGRERVRDVARVLLAEDEAPLLVVSSPYVRARETAEIVLATTQAPERGATMVIRDELGCGLDPSKLPREFLAAKAKRVMLVGHEPDLSTLVVKMLGGPPVFAMQKAMVVGVRLPDEGAPALRFVLHPHPIRMERASE